MMSYNNVLGIMTDTRSKSLAKLVCCNVGKEIQICYCQQHYH